MRRTMLVLGVVVVVVASAVVVSGAGSAHARWVIADLGTVVAGLSGADSGRMAIDQPSGGQRSYQFPAWSPDGSTIAFAGGKSGYSAWQIFVINADGSNQRQLTTNRLITTAHPAWSPDGRKIAFTCSSICVMNANGGTPRQLIPNASGLSMRPAWSPDGTRIAFDSSRSGIQGIYIMNADGSSQHRLTKNASDPTWSPDGRKVAFVSGDNGIFVMNADGSNRRQLTRRPAYSYDPAWSPDGRRSRSPATPAPKLGRSTS